ncbi:Holliday junction resolvase RuvX [Candidatus Uhrbacteria bacterium CG_4_9_14_3_um_filter_36_7]|uniref:Putative pre-16S rRNA nuclease n=1 Tax=Candidatus Uhrbacteria bacterium CG_4_9_14_3_um_filter_36_7 TaxID=1975033 RepID=A0A2M7XIG0_9BACT|nr:MAG: Holliday junction resolvase RuvX [Candidatus Uhrbacteria bacterium CG_4_9_14_3_um_filter_36_7]
MRILGIDYGDKKIGLAFGDSQADVAVPLDVVPNLGEATLQVFKHQIHTEDIDRVVVGVPYLNGKRLKEDQLQKTKKFIENLRSFLSIPVEEEDESYTTFESVRLQREEGSKVPEDALAAMLIVRQYFERLKE